MASAGNLIQVMLHVAEVILHQEFKRYRLVVANLDSMAKRACGNCLDQVKQVKVVAFPEEQKIRPTLGCVLLYANPALLLVAGRFNVFAQLSTDKSLMIVRC